MSDEVNPTDDNEDYFVGIQAHLMDHKTKKRLALSSIQDDKSDEWKQSKFDFVEPIEALSIRWDEFGVCDLVFFVNGVGAHMNEGSDYCDPALDDTIKEHAITVSEAAPLVGFHGLVEDGVLVNLGVIMLNTVDSQCRKSKDNSNIFEINGWDPTSTETADYYEDSITNREDERAAVLDAILHFDRIADAEQSKATIIGEIEELMDLRPIQANEDGHPESAEDL